MDQLNLKSVSRVDAAAQQIHQVAKHTVVYQYREDTERWDKVEVEGSLMLYQRNEEPEWAFIILNRLHPNNFIVIMDEVESVHLEQELLIVQLKEAGTVYGIWFYRPEDRDVLVEWLSAIKNDTIGQLVKKQAKSVDAVTALFKNVSMKKSEPTNQSLLDALKGTSPQPVKEPVKEVKTMQNVRILSKPKEKKPEPDLPKPPTSPIQAPALAQAPVPVHTPIERSRSSTEPLPPLAPTQVGSLDGVLLDYLKKAHPTGQLRPDQMRQTLYQLLHNKEFLYDLYLLYSENN